MVLILVQPVDCAPCAVPVGINTGSLTKKLRQEKGQCHTGKAKWVGDHFDGVTSTVRTTLKVADAIHGLIGTSAMTAVTKGAHNLSGKRIPLWTDAMPKAANPKDSEPKPAMLKKENIETVVYFPSCVSRNMAPSRNDFEKESLVTVMTRLLEKAGYNVILPDNLPSLCCGQPFASKGQPEAAKQKAEELHNALLKASNNGEYPILSDTNSCSWQQKESGTKGLQVLDVVEFIHDHLLDRIDVFTD